MRLFIGQDRREADAYDVAARSARKFGCAPEPLDESRLRRAGLLTRPVDNRGQAWDFVSGAPQSTDFANSRFFVPLLAHSGLAMFVDCDVLFMEDPRELIAGLEPGRAVYCVQHPPFASVAELVAAPQQSGAPTKMDGQAQTVYPRKLWSSVMIFDCDHPANARLNLTTLNAWPGRDLHAFRWLADSELGALPPEANWLVGLQARPDRPIIAHYTLGTPNMPGLEACDYADLWMDARSDR